MVIARAIEKIAYPHRNVKMPKYRNPIQYLIGDSISNRKTLTKKRQKQRARTFKHVPLKRLEGTSDIADISTTPQAIYFNSVPQGTSVDGERTEQRITAHSLNFKSTILWESDPAQTNEPTTVRFLLMTVEPGFAPGTENITTTANVYDKRDFPNIGHVYKDFRVVRKQTTTQATPIHIYQDLNNIKFQYDGDAGTDNMENRYSRLVLVIVGDLATPTKTDMNQTRYVFRYRG